MRCLSQVFLLVFCVLKLFGYGVVWIALWHVVGGFVAAVAEQEFFHFAHNHFFGFGVHGVQSIFVNQHGLVVYPLVPGLL